MRWPRRWAAPRGSSASASGASSRARAAGPARGPRVLPADGQAGGTRPVRRRRRLDRVHARRPAARRREGQRAPRLGAGDGLTIRGASGWSDDGGVDIGHGHPDAMELRLPAVFLIDSAGAASMSTTNWAALHPRRPRILRERLEPAQPGAGRVGRAGAGGGGSAPLPPLAHFSVMAKGTGQVFPRRTAGRQGGAGHRDRQGGSGRLAHPHPPQRRRRQRGGERGRRDRSGQALSQLPARQRLADAPARRHLGRPEPPRRALLSLIPRDIRRVYDPYVMIEGVFDAGSFFEIAPAYGRSRVIGLARTHGYPIGVITSNPKRKGGSMDTAAAEKSTRLVQLCDTFHIPLVILLDEPGVSGGRGVGEAGRRARRRAPDARHAAEHHALGVDHPAADLRPGRRHPVPRGAAPLSPLRLGLGTLGVDAHRGRHRRRLPARHRRSARSRREARRRSRTGSASSPHPSAPPRLAEWT